MDGISVPGSRPLPRCLPRACPCSWYGFRPGLGWPGYATFRLDARAPTPVRYRFALTGAVPSTHDILVENAKARMAPAGTATPHVTLRCATDIFVLMMYRRLTLEPVMAAGQLVVEGEQGLTAAFDRWLKGA